MTRICPSSHAASQTMTNRWPDRTNNPKLTANHTTSQIPSVAANTVAMPSSATTTAKPAIRANLGWSTQYMCDVHIHPLPAALARG